MIEHLEDVGDDNGTPKSEGRRKDMCQEEEVEAEGVA